MNENIVNSLWKAIEAKEYTWNDLANGVNIKFSFDNKEYSINSKVMRTPRVHSMDSFSEELERTAINEVLKNSINNESINSRQQKSN